MKKANTLSFIDLLPHLPREYKQSVRARTYTREGGVSPEPYGGLNLGLFTGDHPSNVEKNLELVARHMGIEPSEIVALEQVHGRDVLLVDSVAGVAGMADALVTGRRGMGLLIQHADCGALVLFDPTCPAIAALHVGWRGLKKGVIEGTMECLEKEFGTKTWGLWAGLSPVVGPCCYEFKGWQGLLPGWMWEFIDGQDHLDLIGAIISVLERHGIDRERIYAANECTCCSKRLFSFRRRDPCGRIGTLISLA